MPFVRVTLKSLRKQPFDFEPQTLGEHIKKRRLELGLSQKGVGDKLGVTLFTVLNWETGQTEIHIEAWPGILAFLGYDPLPAPETIPERMLVKRRVMGWSIKEAAKVFGVDEGTWGDWERGNTVLFKKHRARLASLLNVSVNEVDEEMGALWVELHRAKE